MAQKYIDIGIPNDLSSVLYSLENDLIKKYTICKVSTYQNNIEFEIFDSEDHYRLIFKYFNINEYNQIYHRLKGIVKIKNGNRILKDNTEDNFFDTISIKELSSYFKYFYY